jgi:hypothetical protein
MANALDHGYRNRSAIETTYVVRLLLFAFVVVCVFDPADLVFGVKVWLFVAIWVAALIAAFSAPDKIYLPIGLLLCVLLFTTVPLISIVWYYLTSGTEPYAGFALMKSFLLVSVAIVLVTNRVDVLPFLAATLSVLAFLTIAVVIAVLLEPQLLPVLQSFGSRTGIVVLNERRYGDGLSITQVNFVTSQMLAISIPHYFDRAMSEPAIKLRLLYLALTVVCVVGMFLAGLRNTMAVALLLPFVLWPLYTRRVALSGMISLSALVVLSVPFVHKIETFLDPTELSNSIKLTFLGDYAKIFSDPVTLLFGQGLGAYYPWTSSGQPEFEKTGANFYFITELTYAEMIRSFGLVGALPMMMLLLYPVAYALFANTCPRRRALALGFLAYLCMSATNPMLFSSTGMLCFSVLLADTFGTSERGPV